MTNEIKSWKWNYYAGFIPIAAGSVILISYLLALANPDAVWNLIIAKQDFSLNDLYNLNNNAAPFMKFLASFTGVNLVIGGVAVSLIAKKALRFGKKWAWQFMVFALLWVGVLDALGALVFFNSTGIPLLLLPFTLFILMLIGIIKTRKEIFK